MNSNLPFIYLICAIVISSIIGIYSWRHRQTRSCRAFAVLILVSILWMAGSIFFSLSQALSARWIGRAVQFLGIPGVPVALLVFVYRLLHDTDETGVQLIAERIQKKIKRPFKVDGHTLATDTSIGVAVYPENGNNLTELMRYADSAMYRAKSRGGGLDFYDSAVVWKCNLQ